ncbi:large ribosomal subunit protein mL38-like [Caloenas nicobarica]|uniref:large ribosomal subunit protein mL38-like n=1 Tax=Caloenas nicobarica TaxID=187106 RepID=UPI0032B85BAF
MAVSQLSAALCGVRHGRCALKRAAPLGPMPNEDIDVSNLEALEKSRSFSRYLRLGEKESRKPRWWQTGQQHSSPQPEPKTDISLPHEKLLRAEEIKARKKILRENLQNAEMERAAWLRTGLCPAARSLPRPGWVLRCHLQHFPLLVALIPLDKASSPPAVSSEAGKGSLWTVLLTNPAEQPQLSQSLLMRKMLHTPQHLCSPALDSLP